MILLGIDPGRRTGVAVVDDQAAPMLIEHHDIPNGLEGFNEWWSKQSLVYGDEGVAHIIIEDFITREGKHGVDTTPLQIIGAVTTLAGQLRIPLTLRLPSGRLRQVPDSILKRLGVYLPGKANRNAKEAVRHVIAFLKAQHHPVVLAAYNEEK